MPALVPLRHRNGAPQRAHCRAVLPRIQCSEVVAPHTSQKCVWRMASQGTVTTKSTSTTNPSTDHEECVTTMTAERIIVLTMYGANHLRLNAASRRYPNR